MVAPSSPAMVSGSALRSWYLSVDARETTVSPGTLDSVVINVSATPAARASFWGSPAPPINGSTATTFGPEAGTPPAGIPSANQRPRPAIPRNAITLAAIAAAAQATRRRFPTSKRGDGRDCVGRSVIPALSLFKSDDRSEADA